MLPFSTTNNTNGTNAEGNGEGQTRRMVIYYSWDSCDSWSKQGTVPSAPLGARAEERDRNTDHLFTDNGQWRLTTTRFSNGSSKRFFREFLELFCPAEERLIDFSRVEFLREEHFTDVERGLRRRLDLVARVGLKAGGEKFVLVHRRVRGVASRKPDFPRRMFQYFCCKAQGGLSCDGFWPVRPIRLDRVC